MSFINIILWSAIVSTGLVAGVFYGFVVAVNPALARQPDGAYIATMQAINDVIQNPLFAASFFGAPLLLPLAAVLQRKPYPRRFHLLVVAAAIYLVGSFGVTVAANIPLNEKLAAFSLAEATPAQLAVARQQFAAPWNYWHAVRTWASVAALVLVVAAGLWQEPARSKHTQPGN
jgi:uncharacterized membrane protein